jgi:hypothetical protein
MVEFVLWRGCGAAGVGLVEGGITKPVPASQLPSAVVVTKAPEPATITALRVTNTNGIKTMSSLDMVAYINSTRKPGEAVLRHADFLAKVPTVIEDERKFSSVYIAGNGQRQPCYLFPEEESMLMAMSYSYTLQKTVYRAWKEAEAKVAAPVVSGMPVSYLDALKQLVATVEVKEQQALQIAQQAVQIEAAAPAVAATGSTVLYQSTALALALLRRRGFHPSATRRISSSVGQRLREPCFTGLMGPSSSLAQTRMYCSVTPR